MIERVNRLARLGPSALVLELLFLSWPSVIRQLKRRILIRPLHYEIPSNSTGHLDSAGLAYRARSTGAV